MKSKKKGQQSVVFDQCPYIAGAAAVGGHKEGEGPLASCFDLLLKDDLWEEKTWEKAESKMLKTAMERALKKAGKTREEVDLLLSGDLLNQIMASSFMARDLQVPFLGLYGACSTMTESLLLGGMLADGGFVRNVLVGASSHFCTAERQFRMPVEHGNQRPPSAQWTATAAGAMLLSTVQPDYAKVGEVDDRQKMITPRNIRLSSGTIGKVIDAGVKDVNQMGSAMAPAAVDTILNHFADMRRSFADYDLVITGDLGYVGKAIASDLLMDAGMPSALVKARFADCGTMLYDREKQDAHGGASGCGCSAAVFSGHLIGQMRKGELERVLLLSTGAMLSTISPFQGESIPGIAHGVVLEVC